MKSTTVYFFSSTQSPVTVTCEIAETLFEKKQGLIGRSSLPDGQGMLFMFSLPWIRCFWMKGVLFPLDIIFIRKKKIVKIIHASCETALFPRFYCGFITAVIECTQGFCQRYGIEIGSRVDF